MNVRGDEPAPLIVCASPREADAVRSAGLEALVVGVGKTSAALGTAGRLARGGVPAVLVAGIAGLYPDSKAAREGRLDVGSVCRVAGAGLVDEGVETPDGFLELDDDLGFSVGGPFDADPTWSVLLPSDLVDVRAATVSTCAGNDRLASRRAEATGCTVETMESAAIAAACADAGVPWFELRAISNFCGDRDAGRWDVDRALAALGDAVAKVATVNGWAASGIDGSS